MSKYDQGWWRRARRRAKRAGGRNGLAGRAAGPLRVEEVGEVLLVRDAVDFRKGINGLAVLVEAALGRDPFSAALFAFTNKGRDKVKILYWERNGFCLWQKRLEKERFKWPYYRREAVIRLDGAELDWLLEGLDLKHLTPHEALNYTTVL